MTKKERRYGQSMELDEYMPALITGFIGLTGVILGGLLQVRAQHRRDRKHEAFEIRKKVGTLVAHVTLFSAGISQLVTEINYTNELHTSKPSQDPEKLQTAQKHVNKISAAVDQQRNEIQFASIELISLGEPKIAKQALLLQKLTAAASNATSPLTRNHKSMTSAEANQHRDRLMYEADVLRMMVAPRWFERLSRFRRSKTVEKKLSKSPSRRSSYEQK